MIRSLHGKLSLVLMLLLMVSGALLVPLSLFTTRSYNEEVNQHLNRDLASHLALDLSEKKLLTPELKSNTSLRGRTKAEISHLMVLNPNIEIYLLDENGGIVDYSSAPGRVLLSRVDLDPVRRFLAGAGPLPIRGTDPRQPSRGAVFSAAHLPTLPQPKVPSVTTAMQGYIYIVLAGEDYQSIASSIGKSYILRLGTWGIAGILAFTFGAAVLLFPLLTRPLRRLVADLEAFRRHELERTALAGGALPAESSLRRDEIGQLEMAFARLSNRVGDQVQTLQQADLHRREAISNVSHDLRTPLAALQGYLETLLIKEGQLSPQQQREYLMTAMKHAERLNKLIAALFELAKLDSPEMQPNWEDFSLAELVQDVVQQFSLAAEKKKVTLRLECEETLPFVRADISLIERALENLLENALRHTPPQGMVTLSLHREDRRVALIITDDGEGISSRHLPHIFERSYRGVEERGLDENLGAGLGLAISKRIAELHDSTLKVQSELGRGSTFMFSLPLSPE